MRALRLGLLLAIAALGAATVSGCAVVQEKTIGESLDDTSAGTQIRTRLLSQGGISRFGETDVVVSDRLVLLVGRVPTDEARREAEQIAWSVRTVDEVANELVVDERNILRDINDPFLASQVRARLVGDDQIKGVNYNIHVYNGVVYLLGFARNEDELARAADHASRVGGVKKVISYVKMRERAVGREFGAPQGSGSQGSGPQGSGGPVATPAPVAQPQPTQRGAYSDPYAGGSTPASETPR